MIFYNCRIYHEIFRGTVRGREGKGFQGLWREGDGGGGGILEEEEEEEEEEGKPGVHERGGVREGGGGREEADRDASLPLSLKYSSNLVVVRPLRCPGGEAIKR